MTKIQAQNFEGPCLPSAHGLNGHQSAWCGGVQEIALSAGWNWVSFYVEADDLLEQLETSLGSNGEQIKFGNLFTNYYPDYLIWYGSLNSLENEKLYMVKVSNACTVELQGTRANPTSHAITIQEGWNWIGYPCDQAVNVEAALAGFTPANGDQIKYGNVFTTYYSGTGYSMWYGGLTELIPGQGYMYYSNSTETKTLIFQTGAKK
jgi:hypothetical protein